jgi:hypothetical protein
MDMLLIEKILKGTDVLIVEECDVKIVEQNHYFSFPLGTHTHNLILYFLFGGCRTTILLHDICQPFEQKFGGKGNPGFMQ